ncbi:uncharacterized protein GGS22DRAFT_186837 [Annulohypoxylon maeteangense]|uniref:uncharacterized protein n=1 Tax=Annulohypoxylon maeteangense TaxID=1927788 RepID=UPI0020081421|nr:uncharacterized protein GGS22DRAFT_186837 [Annulohypoxylon maeteangense]KAI0886764.1 hypothetical protein GGS22DRAFT_186837 [Annulohypoxylon maeteangense]
MKFHIIGMIFTAAMGVAALPVINSPVQLQVRDGADTEGPDGDWELLKKASISEAKL